MFGLDLRAAVLTRFVARKENYSSRLLCVAFKHEVAPADLPKAFVPNRPIPSVRLIGSASQLLPILPRTLRVELQRELHNCQVCICLKSAIFPLSGRLASSITLTVEFLTTPLNPCIIAICRIAPHLFGKTIVWC